MSLLSDLTIVIPSYNRQNYLTRQINYWKDYDVEVLILDGSTVPNYKLQKSASRNINIIHLPESIERRFGVAIAMINTKYAAMLSDDEFFLPTSLASSIKFLEDNPDYSACKGNAVGFRVDSVGSKCNGIQIYPELKGYKIANDKPSARLIEHMAPYAMASLWAVHRTEVLKTGLALAGRRPPYASAAAFEIQLSLITAWFGKIKVLDELMWLRSYENKNIWWSNGNLPIVDWLNHGKYKNETTQFINDLTETLSASVQEIRDALTAYADFCINREESLSAFQQMKHLGVTFLPVSLTIFIRRIYAWLLNATNKSESTLFQATQALSISGVFVDFDEILKIEAVVKEFHRKHHQQS